MRPVRIRPVTALAVSLIAVVGIVAGTAAVEHGATPAMAATPTPRATPSISALSSPAGPVSVSVPAPCPQAQTAPPVPCDPYVYPDDAVSDLTAQLQSSRTQADTATAGWLTKHPKRDDKGFLKYVVASMGKPPTGSQQTAELSLLHGLSTSRTKTGLDASAARDAREEGRMDPYRTGYRLGVSSAQGATVKAMADLVDTMGQKVADTAKAHYKRPSPYKADPTLDAQNQAKYAGQARYSYPSSHAVIGAGQADVLGHVLPSGAGDYRAMEAQVDYSRLYAGGHYPSDMLRGAFAGQMIGDYAIHFLGAAN